MAESVQKRLGRVRPPRVHVTYDVETGGAIEIKELPFVMGVLGDFSGQPVDPLPKLKDRRFIEITLDNFDSVLESMKPHVAFSVDNKLSEDDECGAVEGRSQLQEYGRFRAREGCPAGETSARTARTPHPSQ